jgi:homoserine kinase
MGTESDPGEIISLVTLQAAKAADMVLAFMHQDLDRLGWIVHHNPMLEAARGPAIPNFQEIKTAGKKAGAAGVSIAGSGPSVFAITDSRDTALRVLDAMLQAADTECHWLISPMGNTGATTVTSITAFVQAGLADTNFMQ